MSFEPDATERTEENATKLNKRLIAMRGLPGSGKTTRVKALYHQLQEEYGHGPYIVSKDSLRILYPEATEKQIHRYQTDELYRLSAQKATPIIVDNTHMDPRSISQLEGFCRFHGYEFAVEEVPTPWYECIIRDYDRRQRGERYVGRSVIIQMAMRYGVFDLPIKPAILCDLDGTLARIEHRRHYVAGPGPKDWPGFFGQLHLDEPNLMLKEILYGLKERYTILYVSGRNSTYRQPTEAWLEKHGLDFHFALFMRGAQDHRDDDVIKQELYERYIKPYFDVHLAIDDRDRVVNMWRANGIECWQVAAGNF
jgi:predicted kinase